MDPLWPQPDHMWQDETGVTTPDHMWPDWPGVTSPDHMCPDGPRMTSTDLMDPGWPSLTTYEQMNLVATPEHMWPDWPIVTLAWQINLGWPHLSDLDLKATMILKWHSPQVFKGFFPLFNNFSNNWIHSYSYSPRKMSEKRDVTNGSQFMRHPVLWHSWYSYATSL